VLSYRFLELTHCQSGTPEYRLLSSNFGGVRQKFVWPSKCGDGSLTVLSTPGHTLGHQSLLVHLKKTGDVVLSGDAVHFQSNWDNRRVPGFNADKAQSMASMEKLAHVLADKHAQLWINHDKPSSDARRHAPEFYE
jgi:N-acyl homoserine lactone hydrolase